MGRSKTIDDAELLAQARELFTRHGHAVSTREIASAVGLSQPALYRRFGSKDMLYAAAMAPNEVDADAILGPPFDPRHETPEHHLCGIVGRLRGTLMGLLPGMLQTAAARNLDPAVVAQLHARAGPRRVSRALAERLQAMAQAGHLEDRVTTTLLRTLLWIVHGQVIGAVLGAESPNQQAREDEGLLYLLLGGAGTRRSRQGASRG